MSVSPSNWQPGYVRKRIRPGGMSGERHRSISPQFSGSLASKISSARDFRFEQCLPVWELFNCSALNDEKERHAATLQTSWRFVPCLCADIDDLQHRLRTQDIVQLLHLKWYRWYQLIKGSKLSPNWWLWRGFNQSAPAFAPATNGQSSENFERAGMSNQNAGHQDRRINIWYSTGLLVPAMSGVFWRRFALNLNPWNTDSRKLWQNSNLTG